MNTQGKTPITGLEAYKKNIARGFIVDKEDIDLLHDYLWYCNDSTVRTNRIASIHGTSILSRIIWQRIEGDDSLKVGHVNGDFRDCRRSNLKGLTNAEINIAKQPKSSTGVKNIYFYKNRYRVEVTRNKRDYKVGYYNTLEDAKKGLNDFLQTLTTEVNHHGN